VTEPRAGGTTRDRIVEATLRTVREEGFADTTARAIARTGGFNQALIFYHFGSVDRLLQEAFEEASARQVEKYRAAASEVSTLQDLVRIARRLHAEDLESGAVSAVVQLMAAVRGPEEGAALLDRFDGWIELVREALERALAGTPITGMVPSREAAYAICAMFLGVELMTRLDPDRTEAEPVFDMLEAIAKLVEEVGVPLLGGRVPGA
jgi:AcrR family transcriptional regulator